MEQRSAGTNETQEQGITKEQNGVGPNIIRCRLSLSFDTPRSFMKPYLQPFFGEKKSRKKPETFAKSGSYVYICECVCVFDYVALK